MEYYAVVKHLHMSLALVSLIGFILRGYWMLSNNRLLSVKPVKILPHIIDTLLLGSAIYLMIITSQYPFVIDWLTLKVVLLAVYIGAGVIALKPGRTKQAKVIAFVVAVAAISAMFAIASIKPVIF
ncbi:SirB2 family protein [Aliikangiella sp. IMCC44653]